LLFRNTVPITSCGMAPDHNSRYDASTKMSVCLLKTVFHSNHSGYRKVPFIEESHIH